MFTHMNTWKIGKDDDDSNKGCILLVDAEYRKNLHDLHNDLPFLPQRMKINKCSKLLCCCMIKITMLFT